MLRITIQVNKDEPLEVIEVQNINENNNIPYSTGDQIYEINSNKKPETIEHKFKHGYKHLTLKALKTLWHLN
jgi:hypothetical protein